MSDYTYVGSELELFQAARNWKAYLKQMIKPWLGPNVLEVGAGLGGTTRALCGGAHKRWVCLEPDLNLAEPLKKQITARRLPHCCEFRAGTIADLPPGDRFDSILYIDVMEHIEDDVAEFARAAERLTTAGRIIVLSPAHPWLFSEFDREIGHFRRYTKKTLAAAAGTRLRRDRLIYLDSVGLLASSANRFMLKKSMPNAGQIKVWDSLMVPVSRVLDPLLMFSVGKSVLGVWRRP
ncbi:MAG: class I SAM-dependent methyltransferase [Planctomycetes bacterium]|nr:class I SAM-dependent methyltransferase [Planctomycetota bacterium]